jgi:integral membrane protein
MIQRAKYLRWIGLAEGVSFLVLLLIAMPLKYALGLPMAVKVVGWAHGVLFILYIGAVLLAIRAIRWKLTFFALAASVIPGGTFFLDRTLRKRASLCTQVFE